MNLEQLEKRLAQLAELRKAAEARSSAVLDVALAANRTMTDEEAATVADARAEVAKIDTEAGPLDTPAQVLRKAQADADAANADDVVRSRSSLSSSSSSPRPDS